MATLDFYINECTLGLKSCTKQLEEEMAYYASRSSKFPSQQEQQWHLEVTEEIRSDIERLDRDLLSLNQIKTLIQAVPAQD